MAAIPLHDPDPALLVNRSIPSDDRDMRDRSVESNAQFDRFRNMRNLLIFE